MFQFLNMSSTGTCLCTHRLSECAAPPDPQYFDVSGVPNCTLPEQRTSFCFAICSLQLQPRQFMFVAISGLILVVEWYYIGVVEQLILILQHLFDKQNVQISTGGLVDAVKTDTFGMFSIPVPPNTVCF